MGVYACVCASVNVFTHRSKDEKIEPLQQYYCMLILVGFNTLSRLHLTNEKMSASHELKNSLEK